MKSSLFYFSDLKLIRSSYRYIGIPAFIWSVPAIVNNLPMMALLNLVVHLTAMLRHKISHQRYLD